MLSGVLYGLGACVLWGFVYLVPLVLPDYDPVIIATARYISFGLVAVPLMWMQRHEFAHYTLKDWGTACALGVLGNCVYYWLLLNCINMAGAPFAGMCMALIPVLVAVIANLRDKKARTVCPLAKPHTGSGSYFCGPRACQHLRI
ncbi:MAG: DMT family transporter [Duodenibacillus massiliensis]